MKMKRRDSRRSTIRSTDSGAPADRVSHGDLVQAATLSLEIAPRFDLDELSETEWSAFMSLVGPDTRP